MSTITPTITNPEDTNGRCRIISWTGIAEGDTCAAARLSQFADRTVQIEGTFGGATITIEGSLDTVNFHVLTDPQGNAISAGSAKLEAISELTYDVKPVITDGSGSDITVTLLLKE